MPLVLALSLAVLPLAAPVASASYPAVLPPTERSVGVAPFEWQPEVTGSQPWTFEHCAYKRLVCVGPVNVPGVPGADAGLRLNWSRHYAGGTYNESHWSVVGPFDVPGGGPRLPVCSSPCFAPTRANATAHGYAELSVHSTHTGTLTYGTGYDVNTTRALEPWVRPWYWW